jgi:hypothetical protein
MLKLPIRIVYTPRALGGSVSGLDSREYPGFDASGLECPGASWKPIRRDRFQATPGKMGGPILQPF